MKEFNKLFIDFKNLKTKKTETHFKKEQIMKNVDELYKNYYNAYKSDFDTNDELTENKKKNFNYQQFEINKGLKLTKLPKWIRVNEERFNEILSTITGAKNNGLTANIDGKEITLEKAESLPKEITSGEINKKNVKEKYNHVVNDVIPISNKEVLTENQNNIVKILLQLKEIFRPKDKKKTNNQTLQICLNEKAKNWLNKEEINKEKA